MKRKFVLSTALISVMAATSSASAHIVETRGGAACATWAQQRPKNSKLLETWLLGYLSGMAQQADIDVPKAVDNDAIFRWMDDYCRRNPQQRIVMGGYLLFGKLRTEGGLK